MEPFWQFISPIISSVITALLSKWISEFKGPQRWQVVIGIIATAVVLTTILILAAQTILTIGIRPGRIDLVAASTSRSVFTQQVNGQAFIGVTYQLSEQLTPHDYKTVQIAFEVTPDNNNSNYYLVIGNDTENYLFLERSNPRSGVSYHRQDGSEEFDVPISLFPRGKDLIFDQIHVMTPYQPLGANERLSFSIQKMLLEP